jgi:CDP-diacylglycerol--serine O-phosphatidyltransferase
VPFAYILIVPLAFIVIALKPAVVLFVMFSAYALSGPLFWATRRLRRRLRTPNVER